LKRVLTFIAFLSLLASFGNEGWVKLYKLRQFERMMETENRTIAQNNTDLQLEIENLSDPRYLEHYIRQQIGFIRENELIYEFVDESHKK